MEGDILMANKPRKYSGPGYSPTKKKEPKIKPGAKKWIKFSVAVLLIAFFVIMLFVEMPNLNYNSVKNIKTGIDIRGGVSATLYPEVDDIDAVTEDQLRTIQGILEQRIEARGTFDYNMSPDFENKRLLLEIPYASGDDTNPQKVIDDLGEMAKLTFQRWDEEKYEIVRTPYGNEIRFLVPVEELKDDDILLDGSDVAEAAPYMNTQENSYSVSLKFQGEGVEKFAQATSELVGKPIAIYLDDELKSYPIVQQTLAGGEASITGNFSGQEAIEMANYIQYGALPFAMTAKEINSITPVLGESALNVTLRAAVLAFILVVCFMIFRYRLPGLVASVSLAGLVASILFWLLAFNASITLPGIAGIILTIGMGVDANVIIYERIKEELRNGMALEDAIDVGFKKAFSAIFDANVTTLISGGALYIVGSGPIKGFALTLIIGVLMSFFIALVIVKYMLKALSTLKIFSRKWYYGVKEVTE